jgi:ABC-type Mn2+/Zn2+ transport system permease subunit
MEMNSLCQRRNFIKSRRFSLSDTITFGVMVSVFVGSTAGYLGSIMVSRHMALVGDALSHVALPGLALGILFNFNPFIGAFAFLAATVIVTGIFKNLLLSR